MRIATYNFDGQTRVGLVSNDGKQVSHFSCSPGEIHLGALPLIEKAARGETLPPTSETVSIESVRLVAPLPRPRRNLFCVGRNYRAHAKELSSSVFAGNDARSEWPIVFTKVPESVVGPYDNVELPVGVSDQIDYEAELAVVISKAGRSIRRSEAMSYVFGYTIVNDVTARDVQMRHQQWHLGKSFDTFCPMGPWIVSADDLDGTRARVRCWVNNELRQDGNIQDLIFDIPTLIETCSRGVTLYPGDVIATGTPAGVGLGFSPPRFLRGGDVVRIAIDGLGEISNLFR